MGPMFLPLYLTLSIFYVSFSEYLRISFFLQVYRSITDIQKLHIFNVLNLMSLDIYTYDTISTIKVINIFITSKRFLTLLWVFCAC